MSYFWPPDLAGIVPQLALSGEWGWHDEMFLNNVAIASQIPGWATVTGGGGALVGSAPAEPSGRGVVQWDFTRSPVALPAAWRRGQAQQFAPANNYLALPIPNVWAWGRWRMLSMPPAVPGPDNYYKSAFGIAQEAANVVEPTNGMGIVFDPTFGVAQWVLRAWRAGVAIQLPLGFGWVQGATGNTLGWKTVAINHRGSRIDAYVGDPRLGVPMALVGSLAGAEIQPASSVLVYHDHTEQRDMGLSFNPRQQTDFIGFGGGVS